MPLWPPPPKMRNWVAAGRLARFRVGPACALGLGVVHEVHEHPGVIEVRGTALDVALWLVHSHKAQLHMILVDEIRRIPGSREEIIGDKEFADRKFAAVVEKSLTEAKRHRVKLTTYIVVGHAVPTIVDFIERDGFDLLVTAFMGHSALYYRSARGTRPLSGSGGEIASS